MSIYSGVVGAQLGQDTRPSAQGTDVLPRHRHVLARATVVVASCLALLMLTVIAFARVGTVPSIPPFLQQLWLSGHVPVTANCVTHLFHQADCLIEVDDKDVALSLDTRTDTITLIVVSGDEYRLGDLILAWGTPTGITYYNFGCRIDVFWDTRTAELYTCALQPYSPIAYIEYALDPHPLSSWRGFTTTHDCSC